MGAGFCSSELWWQDLARALWQWRGLESWDSCGWNLGCITFGLQGGEKLLQLDMITERLSKQVMENHEEMGKSLILITTTSRGCLLDWHHFIWDRLDFSFRSLCNLDSKTRLWIFHGYVCLPSQGAVRNSVGGWSSVIRMSPWQEMCKLANLVVTLQYWQSFIELIAIPSRLSILYACSPQMHIVVGHMRMQYAA